jgi:hypothetical protein|tara:strand:+ start:554 stop:730 length:177 start_codon:yes stop_codon:yes gene_type:complete
MEIEEQGIHLESKAFQAHQMKKDLGAVQDGVKDADAMYQFKNMTYIYADNVSEKLQFP